MAYTFSPLKVNLNSQNESIVTYCTHVHQLFRQISNLSDMILLICSFIVVPRELLFLFVQWHGHDSTLPPLSFLPCVERVRGGMFSTQLAEGLWGASTRLCTSLLFVLLPTKVMMALRTAFVADCPKSCNQVQASQKKGSVRRNSQVFIGCRRWEFLRNVDFFGILF